MSSRAMVTVFIAALLATAASPSLARAAEATAHSVLAHFGDEDALFLAIYERVAGATTGFDADEELRIAESVHQAALAEGVDPFLILAVIHVESSFKKGQRSSVGALGLMQVKPSTAEAFAAAAGVRWRGAATLFDVESNIRIGARYLAFKLQRFDDDEILALAAYCHGPTRVRRILRNEGGLDQDHQRYSRRVLRTYAYYRGAVGIPVG